MRPPDRIYGTFKPRHRLNQTFSFSKAVSVLSLCRSRLTVTHDGVSRSSTLIVTALDTSFDRLIAEANDVLGLGRACAFGPCCVR